MTDKPKLDDLSNQRPVLYATMWSAVRELRQSQYVGENQGENTNKLYSWIATMWQGSDVGGQYNRIFFSEEFTWQQSLVPRGVKCFCSWPPTWQPWRHLQTSNRAFSWRHDGHIVVPKQWNSGHVGFSNQSCGSWTFFLCKNLLLFR